MKKEVMILTGAEQIGMAIARRLGTGKKIIVGDKNINNEEKYFVMNHTDKTQQLGDKTIKPYEAFITDHI